MWGQIFTKVTWEWQGDRISGVLCWGWLGEQLRSEFPLRHHSIKINRLQAKTTKPSANRLQSA